MDQLARTPNIPTADHAPLLLQACPRSSAALVGAELTNRSRICPDVAPVPEQLPFLQNRKISLGLCLVAFSTPNRYPLRPENALVFCNQVSLIEEGVPR